MVKDRRLSLNRHPSTAPGPPPRFVAQHESLKRGLDWARSQLNFYRVHMLFFILMPLVAAAIFYASNGETHIPFIDCLFMVVSCLTVTGLNSVLLATLTTWQQVILFLMMTMGSTSSVSIVTIIIRRRFFRRKFEYLVETNAAVRRRVNMIGEEEARAKGETFVPYQARPDAPLGFSQPRHSLLNRFISTPPPSGATTPNTESAPAKEKEKEKEAKKKKKKQEKLSVSMIKRVDAPVRVNAMSVGGWLSEEEKRAEGEAVAAGAVPDFAQKVSDSPKVDAESEKEAQQSGVSAAELTRALERRRETSVATSQPETKQSIQIDEPAKPIRSPLQTAHRRLRSMSDSDDDDDRPRLPRERQQSRATADDVDRFPRSRTIEFRDDGDDGRGDLRLRRHRTYAANDEDNNLRSNRPAPRRMSQGELRRPDRTFTRTASMNTSNVPDLALHSGFGGFPNPITAVAGLARRKIPALGNTLERAMTMPRTQTFASVASGGGSKDPKVKSAPYTSFDLIVGRNSRFHGLTTAQQEELGGVEFRALTVLLRVVAGYYLLSQLIAVLALAPWLTYSKTYAPVFTEYGVHPTWFVFFQVWSAFSNNGMSLVDASMVPFQRAYWLVIVLSLLILGGNTAFPVFLRFVIWCLSKMVPAGSRTKETLQFLLDHPRRCFIYLFPSHQTWFLLFVLVVLNSIDWISFLVLDIGNPDIEAIPVGTRIIDGLLQSFAVRAAGFAIVSLSDVAPALQLLYVVMMYIAVYPIAISVRSTNVYEERSMGVFEEELEDLDEEEATANTPTKYIAYHARKQLAFDMWWLVLALWLICIIERHNISTADTNWITIFTLMFEVSSSYGTVGLSLGSPDGTSLAGSLRTLSKLVLCAVMIRGRHRGLPLAIDRAVMLPDLEGDDSRSFGRTATFASAKNDRRLSVLSSDDQDDLSPRTPASPMSVRKRSADEPRQVVDEPVEMAEIGSSVESKVDDDSQSKPPAP